MYHCFLFSLYFISNINDQEWEDEEEIDIPEEILDDSGVITNQSQHPAGDASKSRLATSSPVTGTTVTGRGEGDRSWLSRNVVVQYWEREVDRTMEGTHKYSRIAKQWWVIFKRFKILIKLFTALNHSD